MIKKLSRIFILSWVFINVALLPFAVFAQEPMAFKQQVDSENSGIAGFGKITPLGDFSSTIEFSKKTAGSHLYIDYLNSNIKTAIVIILYSLMALAFFGVYTANLRLGLGKKASLNISVEAIIIIILAITILGLGLGFIRGMFGKVTTEFEEMVSNEPEPAGATSYQPITLSRESIVAEKGQQIAMKVGFYYTGSPNGADNITTNVSIKCGDQQYNASSDDFQQSSKTLSKGESTIITVVFTATDLKDGINLCTLRVSEGEDLENNISAEKDFTIKARS